MRLFDILKKRKSEEANEMPEKRNDTGNLPELPHMEFKEMRQIWNVGEAKARQLCRILLREGVLEDWANKEIDNKSRKEDLKTYCNLVGCKNCIMANRGSCDFDSMTDNKEVRALYEAVYYGEIEQAKEYLKQRVRLIGDELVVELPKDVEEGKIKITFAKCDKTRSELKERKKGESE